MNDKKFLKLQKKWDGILRRKGFDDIEVPPSGIRQEGSHYVKGHTNHYTRQVDRGIPYRKAEWYRLAQQWAHERSWPNHPTWNIRAWDDMADGSSKTQALANVNRHRQRGKKIQSAEFDEWFDRECALMADTLMNPGKHEHTAIHGEVVHLKGMLEEVVDEYTWEVRLEDGQFVTMSEDYLRYKK